MPSILRDEDPEDIDKLKALMAAKQFAAHKQERKSLGKTRGA